MYIHKSNGERCDVFVFIVVACEESENHMNLNPEVQIVSHLAGEEVLEGYPVEMKASVLDDDHDSSQIFARWMLNGVEICPFLSVDSDSQTSCILSFDLDAADVVVQARDIEGGSAEAQMSLSVRPTMEPEALILSPDEAGIFYSEFLIEFEGVISDQEDAAELLSYFWHSSIDGPLMFSRNVSSEKTTYPFR